MKNQKGITLIALVITIIVLLILAGVSIAMLTGENSILVKAKSAGVESDKANLEESIKLAVATIITNQSGFPDDGIDKDELKQSLENVNSDYTFTIIAKNISGAEETDKANIKYFEVKATKGSGSEDKGTRYVIKATGRIYESEDDAKTALNPSV